MDSERKLELTAVYKTFFNLESGLDNPLSYIIKIKRLGQLS